MQNNIQETLRAMVKRGYKYDPETGIVYGLTGKPLKMTKGGTQRYPTFAISVPGVGKGSHGVACHRVAGYFIWGEEIFKPEVQVRHKNGLYDIRACSLMLGTRVENMSDIDPQARSRAAKAGRASQRSKHANPTLADSVVLYIRKVARRDKGGFLLPDELERISKLTGVRKDVVANILRGVTYQNVKG